MKLNMGKLIRFGGIGVAAVLVVVLIVVLTTSTGSSKPMIVPITSLSPTATQMAQATDDPNATADPGQQAGTDPTTTPTGEGTAQVNLKFLGDIAPQDDILSAAYNSAGDYDFTRLFAKVKAELASDLTVASFESVCVETSVSAYSGKGSYNTPVSFLSAMKEAGIDAVTLANSHILDHGMTGITQTITALDAAGINHYGAYTAAGDAEMIEEINGIKIAILSYSNEFRQNLSKLTDDQKTFAVGTMNETNMLAQISRVREKGADVVIVCVHWGELFTRSANSDQKTVAEKLLQAGVDVIIGTHPNTVQSITNKTVSRTDGTQKRGIVAYSLGNFVSEYREQYRDSSILLSLTIEKDLETGEVTVLQPEYMPLWIDSYKDGTDTVFEVVPMRRYYDDPQSMTTESHTRMRAAWSEVTGQIDTNNADLIQ